MNKLDEALKLLPTSLHSNPVVIAMYEAAVIQLQELYAEAEILFDLLSIDNAPEELLDLLAFEKHVDFYDKELSVQQKRELIKLSVGWHRKKGTRGAVEEVVSIVYPNAEVLEWFENNSNPYLFSVYINEPYIQAKDHKRLLKLIAATKNKRSWLEYIAIKIRLDKIVLSEKSYMFDVPYPITNTFHTADVAGKMAKGNATVQHRSYTFDTLNPICGTFVTSTINSVTSNLNVELANEYRNINVLYRRAGENTITGEGEI